MKRSQRNITNHQAVHDAWPSTYNVYGLGADAEMEVADDGVFPSQSDIDAKVTAFEAKDVIMKKIETLEAEVTQRRIRDAFADPTWMNAQEAKIAVERGKL